MDATAMTRREALLAALSAVAARCLPAAAAPLHPLVLTEQERYHRHLFRAIAPKVIELLPGGLTESVLRSLLSDDLPDLARGGKVGMVKVALHQAAKFGHLEVVKLLLAFGADPSRRTPDGRTALDLARWMFFDEVAAHLESVR